MSDTLNPDLKYVQYKDGILVASLQTGSITLSDTQNKYELTASISAEIVCFDIVSVVREDKTLIACVCSDNDTTLYTTDFFEPGAENLTHFDAWHSVSLKDFIDQDDVISNVCISEYATAFSLANPSGDAYYYVQQTGQPWQKYTIDENAQKINSMIFGTVFSKQGLFLLLTIKNEQTLMFQSFIDEKYHKTSSSRYDCHENVIIKITAVDEDNGDSTIYAMHEKGVIAFFPSQQGINSVVEAENDFLLADFSANSQPPNVNSVFSLEVNDTQQSDDKKTIYLLSYQNSLFTSLNVEFDL